MAVDYGVGVSVYYIGDEGEKKAAVNLARRYDIAQNNVSQFLESVSTTQTLPEHIILLAHSDDSRPPKTIGDKSPKSLAKDFAKLFPKERRSELKTIKLAACEGGFGENPLALQLVKELYKLGFQDVKVQAVTHPVESKVGGYVEVINRAGRLSTTVEGDINAFMYGNELSRQADEYEHLRKIKDKTMEQQQRQEELKAQLNGFNSRDPGYSKIPLLSSLDELDQPYNTYTNSGREKNISLDLTIALSFFNRMKSSPANTGYIKVIDKLITRLQETPEINKNTITQILESKDFKNLNQRFSKLLEKEFYVHNKNMGLSAQVNPDFEHQKTAVSPKADVLYELTKHGGLFNKLFDGFDHVKVKLVAQQMVALKKTEHSLYAEIKSTIEKMNQTTGEIDPTASAIEFNEGLKLSDLEQVRAVFNRQQDQEFQKAELGLNQSKLALQANIREYIATNKLQKQFEQQHVAEIMLTFLKEPSTTNWLELDRARNKSNSWNIGTLKDLNNEINSLRFPTESDLNKLKKDLDDYLLSNQENIEKAKTSYFQKDKNVNRQEEKRSVALAIKAYLQDPSQENIKQLHIAQKGNLWNDGRLKSINDAILPTQKLIGKMEHYVSDLRSKIQNETKQHEKIAVAQAMHTYIQSPSQEHLQQFVDMKENKTQWNDGTLRQRNKEVNQFIEQSNILEQWKEKRCKFEELFTQVKGQYAQLDSCIEKRTHITKELIGIIEQYKNDHGNENDNLHKVKIRVMDQIKIYLEQQTPQQWEKLQSTINDPNNLDWDKGIRSKVARTMNKVDALHAELEAESPVKSSSLLRQ